MTTSTNQPDEKTEEAAEIKRKLAWRMGIAGLMIVGLLGGLALFDRFSRSGSTPATMVSDMPQFTEPVPVPQKMVTQPVTPVEPAPDTLKTAELPAEPESSEAPANLFATPSSTPTEPPPPPVVSARPSAQLSTPRPVRPATSAGEKAQRAPETPAEVKRPAESPVHSAAAVSPPAVPLPSVPPPVPARLMSGYALQVGVFSDTQHAEALQAQLAREGITSSIEARVQVGPFENQKEADVMRGKLNTLGIDSILLAPKKAAR